MATQETYKNEQALHIGEKSAVERDLQNIPAGSLIGVYDTNPIPEPTSADADKVLGVDENGKWELKTVSGGTKLYLHTISFNGPQIYFYATTDRQITGYTDYFVGFETGTNKYFGIKVYVSDDDALPYYTSAFTYKVVGSKAYAFVYGQTGIQELELPSISTGTYTVTEL